MVRNYNGWIIETTGGFMTLKRFIAHKSGQSHWAFRLKECKEFCDIRDNGEHIKKLYLEPLYI